MTKWVKINLILFISIVLLALFTRYFSQNGSPSDTANSPTLPLVSPTIIPTQPPAFESTDSAATVLGMAVDGQQIGELERYESSKLSFMTMLPADYVLADDILLHQPQTAFQQQGTARGSCTFSLLSPAAVEHSSTALETLDLPLVSVYTQADNTTVYTLRNEENIPKLEVRCTADWQVTDGFYTILRSLRFL